MTYSLRISERKGTMLAETFDAYVMVAERILDKEQYHTITGLSQRLIQEDETLEEEDAYAIAEEAFNRMGIE